MRYLRRALVVALVVASSPAAADEYVYVAPDDPWSFAAARVAPVGELIGAAAAAVVRGEDAAALPVYGAIEAGPLADWYLGRADALAALEQGLPPLAPAPAEHDRDRVAALYAVRTFRIGDELSALRVLRLRARYQDGIAVWINGREVARRGIDASAPAAAFAERARGPEWETMYVPVVPGLLQPGDNALAVEVRPSAYEAAPALELSLSASTGPRIARGPMVQRVLRTSATIAFDTDLPARGVIEYGVGGALDRVARTAGGALAAHHIAELTDLPAGAEIRYRVIAGGDATPVYAFHTAPAAGEILRVAIYGDVRNGHDTHERIVQTMRAEPLDLVLMTGDLVARGTDEADWQRFFAATRELLPRVPYYPAAGNHDVGQSGAEQRRMNEIFALWPGPPDRPPWGHWYSFDVAGVHFVMLDSNAYARDEQLAWLERDLAAARSAGARAIIAVAHDGPYSRGPHGGNALAAERYAPVLAAHGVSLIATGHDHLYQRGEMKGLPYVVSGGGGAPLYRVRCGVPGRPRCSAHDGAVRVDSVHHYIVLTVYPTHLEMCPKLPDATALEPCVRYQLRSE